MRTAGARAAVARHPGAPLVYLAGDRGEEELHVDRLADVGLRPDWPPQIPRSRGPERPRRADRARHLRSSSRLSSQDGSDGQSGARFSRNAVIPSCPSAEAEATAMTSRAWV